MEIITSEKEEGLLQGRQEGQQEGRQLGIGTTILRQLRRRFGPLSEVMEARVSALPTERLEDLAEALLDFAAPADLDAWLGHAEA